MLDKFTKCIPLLAIMVLMISTPALAASNGFIIEELEFKNSQVADIIRVLSEDAKVNIVATPEAGKKEVTIFLKKSHWKTRFAPSAASATYGTARTKAVRAPTG